MAFEHALLAAILALCGAVADMYRRMNNEAKARTAELLDQRNEMRKCRDQLIACNEDRAAIWKHIAEMNLHPPKL
jgi:hypothetical protein